VQIVIDTSVAFKWIFRQEPGAWRALLLLRSHLLGERRLVVPSFFNYEAPHALAHTKHGLSLPEVRAALAFVRGLRLAVHPMSAGLERSALQLKYEYGLPVFDGYFVATAIRRKCKFVTADKKAYNCVSKLSFVELLSDAPLVIEE